MITSCHGCSNWGQYNDLLQSNCFSRCVFKKKLNQNVSITVECVQGFGSQTVIICEILTENPQSSSTCFSWSLSVLVFSWDPQCRVTLTSAGHCWVLVQRRKQVLNSQQYGENIQRKKKIGQAEKNVARLRVWLESPLLPLFPFRLEQY